MAQNNDIDIIRSHVDTFILRALREKDKYGYEILREIEENSKGLFAVKQPTLYSSLKRLEGVGYIRSYDGDVSAGAQRKYYALTDEGRKLLTHDQQYWEFSRTIIDSLLSNKEFDAENTSPPFDTASIRPLTKRANVKACEQDNSKSDIVKEYKDERPVVNAGPLPEKGEPVSNYINLFDEFYSSSERRVSSEVDAKALDAEVDDAIEIISLQELKAKLGNDGVKLKIYSQKAANEYYVNKFYNSAKIKRDTSIIAYIFIIVEVLIFHFSLDKMLGFTLDNMFITIGAFIVVPLFFIARYFIEPNVQTRAKLNIRATIWVSFLVALNLIIIILLIGFFAFNAWDNVANALRSIVLPTLFMFNIPVNVGIYCLLYRSKRYHIR